MGFMSTEPTLPAASHLPVWAQARMIRNRFGISAPQLARYSSQGMIRTSNIRRPGQSRGIRLFHVGDVVELISKNIEQVDPEVRWPAPPRNPPTGRGKPARITRHREACAGCDTAEDGIEGINGAPSDEC